MYVNPDYAERELGVLHEMIEAARFGLLVLCADGPLAAHIPFVLHREEGPNGTLLAHLAELVDVHEQRFSSGWSLASASGEHVDELLPHIVAFTLEIEAIQGKRKLSQNKTAGDRDGVIRGLRERGGEDEQAIADAMTD